MMRYKLPYAIIIPTLFGFHSEKYFTEYTCITSHVFAKSKTFELNWRNCKF